MIINEIGLMNRARADTATVLQILSSYDYRDRIWIFLELMDGDLTQIIEKYHQRYTENVVKYCLNKILIGIKNIHSKNIVHRDIKSDNILINEKGDLKLSDFGFSC